MPPDLNELMASVATGRPIKSQKEEKEKLLIKVRSLFAGPASFQEKNVYARPFTAAEARKILENAGIKFQRITGAAVSTWPDQEGQVVEAVVAGREVHFHLQHAEAEKWRLNKVYVASSLVSRPGKRIS